VRAGASVHRGLDDALSMFDDDVPINDRSHAESSGGLRAASSQLRG
jgi:hypothetical protein